MTFSMSSLLQVNTPATSAVPYRKWPLDFSLLLLSCWVGVEETGQTHKFAFRPKQHIVSALTEDQPGSAAFCEGSWRIRESFLGKTDFELGLEHWGEFQQDTGSVIPRMARQGVGIWWKGQPWTKPWGHAGQEKGRNAESDLHYEKAEEFRLLWGRPISLT